MSELSNYYPSNIATLLDAVAEEIALTAREIAELGTIVFTDNTIGDRHTRLRKLDAFDLLRGKCEASAQLVQALAFAVEAQERGDATVIVEALAAVPSQQMRDRLQTALRNARPFSPKPVSVTQ